MVPVYCGVAWYLTHFSVTRNRGNLHEIVHARFPTSLRAIFVHEFVRMKSRRADNDHDGDFVLGDSTPHLKDLWVARAFELAQRQCAVTHALTKLTLNGKPVRMGANVVTRALAKSVQRQAQLSQLLDSRGTQLDWRDQMFSNRRWTVCWRWRDSEFRIQK